MSNESTKAWIQALEEMPKDGPDFRWIGPTESCLCGGNVMVVLAVFDEQEISSYFIDVKCLACGAMLTAPTDEELFSL